MVQLLHVPQRWGFSICSRFAGVIKYGKKGAAAGSSIGELAGSLDGLGFSKKPAICWVNVFTNLVCLQEVRCSGFTVWLLFNHLLIEDYPHWINCVQRSLDRSRQLTGTRVQSIVFNAGYKHTPFIF